MKKGLCFIGYNVGTCAHVRQQLEHYLGRYVDVDVWCLSEGEPPEGFGGRDLYIVSSNTVLESVRPRLPAAARVAVAARTINTENLDLLLDLVPGTRALVVGTSEETAQQAVDTLRSFGFDYLELLPYHPGGPSGVPSGFRIAITMGNANLVPPGPEECINLGVRGIDLSTYVQIVHRLEVPVEALNAISYDYVEALLKLSARRQHLVRLNKTLSGNMEAILNSLDKAILAVNAGGDITLANPAAAALLGRPSADLLGRKAELFLPQIDFGANLGSGEPIKDEIKKFGDTHLIVSGTPSFDEGGVCNGLVVMLRPVKEVEELETKVRRELKRRGNLARYTFADVIGDSAALREGITLARKFASTEMTVLLEGESGTGKELFAQAIHNASQRKNGPFVALNFAALPGELAESELFGYEHGAFTGAKAGGKCGLFEAAHKGTIFLDEIGDASLEVQKKLLRVLEEREVRRVGGNTVTPIDVRVVAATNVDLQSLVQDHRFRSDLFYRLCALPIVVPPLRERKADILTLAQAFAERFSGKPLQIEAPLAEFLRNYDWPGNIRELQNVVKYICSVRTDEEAVTIRHLQPYLARKGASAARLSPTLARPSGDGLSALLESLVAEGQLALSASLLRELRRSTEADRGMGRSSILRRIKAPDGSISEYRLRSLLKRLEAAGCISTGVTKQGRRITARGEELLAKMAEAIGEAC